MLRKRPPLSGPSVSVDGVTPLKQYAKRKKTKHVSLGVLASTLSAAVLAAINPLPDVRSAAYSEYLTSQVYGLTIGWHIFRTITEGAFLASYGIAFNTLVVQVFWTMSVGSVLMYMLQHSVWLLWRETICVWTNIAYGIITILKIFHLVDRLPNENHYMFKHCFLTMADAAFSQTPVHKQYVVQFAEAFIRVIVWRRYNVLADTPTWGVISISLAWQIWLVTFSSMLQARHVSAFRQQQGASGSADPSMSTTPVASRPASCDVGSSGGLASHATASTAAFQTLQTSKNPRTCLTAAVANSIGSEGGGARLQPVSGTSHVGSTSVSSQKHFMKALRAVARGPSSYVLLSHQRRQAGGPQYCSAQFYVSGANPDMLSGNWRERLTSAIAEGAPGWQVGSICVRKGSLIVHLDLVYLPTRRGSMEPTMATADLSAAASGAAVQSRPAVGTDDFGFPGASYSEQPFDTACPFNPKTALDDYIGSMDAEGLLELLGLPADLPDGYQPITVQVGDQLKHLLPAHGTSADPCTIGEAVTNDKTTTSKTGPEMADGSSCSAAAELATVANSNKPAVTRGTAYRPELWKWLLVIPLRIAFRPPADLRSPEYRRFLSDRVAALHLAYAGFICLTAVALPVVRVAKNINPVTLVLFISTELLTLASHATLGHATWCIVRCGLMYAGVAARTLQMAACASGFLPHVLRDSDCVTGRWIQKVVLITTLQGLCMQAPVRTFFLVRLPSVFLSIYVHVFVCQTGATVLNAAALHLGWEALLFLISSFVQVRHLEAFRRQYGSDGCFDKDLTGAVSVAETCGLKAKRDPLLQACACGLHDDQEGSAASSIVTMEGNILSTEATVTTRPQPAQDVNAATDSAAMCVPAAAPGDPYGVSLSAPIVAMAPRRAASLQLHFTCTPAIVEELQVVLRHINPAAMSSGVHSAHTVRDITRGLVAPADAIAAPQHLPDTFTADLTLVAATADMPGLVYVELWRGRRRVCSHPVLLVAAPELLPSGPGDTPAVDEFPINSACTARTSTSGTKGSVGSGTVATWLDDIRAYMDALHEEGHTTAANQFVEELGFWLAQVAALERGLLARNSFVGAAPRVANVLYFHGYGSDFMYVKPRHISGTAGSCERAATEMAAADPLQDTLRQLLLCQGSMLLAVAVEAGCVALSVHLLGLLVGKVGTTLPGVLDSTRTPVTQLPLLHAAVKSGSTHMVDLVAEWSTNCGLKDIWAHEASILAVSSCSFGSSTIGDTASLEATIQRSAGSGSNQRCVAGARRSPCPSFHLAKEGVRRTSSTFGAFEVRQSGQHPDTAADANSDMEARPLCGNNAADGVSATALICAGMDTLGSMKLKGLDADAEPEPGFDVEDMYKSEESPFKVIDFRASNISVAATGDSAAAAGSSTGMRNDGATTAAEIAASAGSRNNGMGGSGLSHGLRERGVLVLTPLHMSLALGDGGRLANYILRTYPEAYELWRTSHINMEPDGSVRSEASTMAAESLASSAGRFIDADSSTSTGAMTAHMAATAPAYSSMPGLASAAKSGSKGRVGGGGGMSGDGGAATDDSLDAGSLRSISLSEVAFFEGMRWVHEDAPARRAGFKVVRM